MFQGYVVSVKGTFGVVHRNYQSNDGVPIVLIRQNIGFCHAFTPVRASEVIQLNSSYETEAIEEAKFVLMSRVLK